MALLVGDGDVLEDHRSLSVEQAHPPFPCTACRIIHSIARCADSRWLASLGVFDPLSAGNHCAIIALRIKTLVNHRKDQRRLAFRVVTFHTPYDFFFFFFGCGPASQIQSAHFTMPIAVKKQKQRLKRHPHPARTSHTLVLIPAHAGLHARKLSPSFESRFSNSSNADDLRSSSEYPRQRRARIASS